MTDLTVSTDIDSFMASDDKAGARASLGVERAFRKSYPPGSVFVQVGDSNTDNAVGRPGWQYAVNNELTSSGGPLYGCTDVNLGNNGAAILDWKNSIATPTVSTTLRGNANAVVNNNPDLIIISLGTNELWSAARRASFGVEATMQANFDTLINFFLDNTNADIWLRMPQPFSQPNAFGDWANADAAAASSEQLRRVHLAWKNKSPRVLVFDSHAAVFGFRVDSRSSGNGLDSETGAALHDDDLHLTNLGYRRMCAAMADQLIGHKRRAVRIKRTPDSILSSAVWSMQGYISNVESGTIINCALDPMQNFAGLNFIKNEADLSYPDHVQQLLLPMRFSQPVVPQMAYVTSAGGSANSLKCWCHASGKIVTMTSVSISQRVTATAGAYYDQVVVSGGSTTFDSGDVGPCTWFVSDMVYAPSILVRNRQKEEFVLKINANYNDLPVTNDSDLKFFGEAWVGVQMTGLYAGLAPSGGTFVCQLYHNSSPVLPTGGVIASGATVGTFAGGPGPTDFAAGSSMSLFCSSNAGNARQVVATFSGYRVLY